MEAQRFCRLTRQSSCTLIGGYAVRRIIFLSHWGEGRKNYQPSMETLNYDNYVLAVPKGAAYIFSL